jgi:hypothetical protein
MYVHDSSGSSVVTACPWRVRSELVWYQSLPINPLNENKASEDPRAARYPVWYFDGSIRLTGGKYPVRGPAPLSLHTASQGTVGSK